MDKEKKFDLIAAIDAQKKRGQTEEEIQNEFNKVIDKEFPRLLQEALLSVRSRLECSAHVSFKAKGADGLIISALETKIELTPIDPYSFFTGYRGKIEVRRNDNETNYSIVMVGPPSGPWSLKIAKTVGRNKEPEIQEFTPENIDHLLGRLLNLTQ